MLDGEGVFSRGRVGTGFVDDPIISKMERPSCRGGPDSVFEFMLASSLDCRPRLIEAQWSSL